MNKILFVYTANRCRSPMAERLFLRLLKKQEAFDIANWMVSSAGTWAESDIAPDENLITVLDAYDNTIRNHRIQAVTKPMLATQNLVLVMARHHLEALRFENPELGGKIYLLSQITGKNLILKIPLINHCKIINRRRN